MTDDGNINDPLSKFYEEEQSRTAGVRDPVTGIRVDADIAQNRKNRTEETKRKSQVSQRVITQLLFEENGREWLYDLLTSCHIFDIPVAEISKFHAGNIHVGKLVESDLKRVNIQKYNLMIQEGYERERLWNDDAADR